MQLDERKFMILKAIIDDYVLTGMPVGSRTISRKSGVGFSPATIRNEMSDLEELGYLDQPHTSAGRVPSHKAYRLYVDRLLQVGNLSPEETKKIQAHLRERTSQVQEVIRSAAQVLSDATHYTSVIVAPQAQALRIRRVQLVPITENTALLVIVTNAGIVKDAVVRVPGELSAEHLHAISNLLTDQLADQPIDQVRQRFRVLIHQLGEHRRLLANVMNAHGNQHCGAERKRRGRGRQREPFELSGIFGYRKGAQLLGRARFQGNARAPAGFARRRGIHHPHRQRKRSAGIPGLLGRDCDLPHWFGHERHAGHHRPYAHGLSARDRCDENAEIRDERAFVWGIKPS